ncbi:MAG: DUF1207 domain-containing protein [Planctomycetaceae bacterium]|jgi:hypothetical protein|nr:DUF1207 domain-containing protein [Planctomycetaceae bacterium]
MFRHFFSILQGYVVLSAAFVFGEELPPIHFNLNEQCVPVQNADSGIYSYQVLPDGQIFPDYLAYTNASRLGGVWNHDEDLGWIWDINLGGRSGLFRYGNKSAVQPEGFQIDIEGNAHLRLDLNNYGDGHSMDMDANDFRFGVPFSWGNKFHQIRTGYYHTSSHLGDERLIRLLAGGSEHQRINYVREAWILGYAYKPTLNTRLYAEADFAFDTGEETKPWHFLLGAEYSNPYRAGTFAGSPFAAVNVMLMQEHNYDGNITVQTGWQWRGKCNQMFRIGLQYFGGVSEQYEHIRQNREHKFGIGLWYDF